MSLRVVSRPWIRFQETGSYRRRPGQGRGRATTARQDRYLQNMTCNRRSMAKTLQNDFQQATLSGWKQISGLWLWQTCEGMETSRRTIRRLLHHGERSIRYGGGSVMVWQGQSIDGRTDLAVYKHGIIMRGEGDLPRIFTLSRLDCVYSSLRRVANTAAVYFYVSWKGIWGNEQVCQLSTRLHKTHAWTPPPPSPVTSLACRS